MTREELSETLEDAATALHEAIWLLHHVKDAKVKKIGQRSVDDLIKQLTSVKDDLAHEALQA